MLESRNIRILLLIKITLILTKIYNLLLIQRLVEIVIQYGFINQTDHQNIINVLGTLLISHFHSQGIMKLLSRLGMISEAV